MKFVLHFTVSAVVELMMNFTPILAASMAYCVADVVAKKGLSIQRRYCSSTMLSLQIGDQLGFLGLLEGHHFEMEFDLGRVQRSDQLRASVDFLCRER